MSTDNLDHLKATYIVEITVEVEATQQPDPQDFIFDASKTARDIDLYFISESWDIYETS